ncbi:MAG: hypothetical protein IJJ01_10100 [Firmicutes bacterium]|nr:hypothetical protein [Bacillota bacterium]
MDDSKNVWTARKSVINCSGLAQLNFLKMLSGSIRELVVAEQTQIDLMKQELALLREASLNLHCSGENRNFYSYDRSRGKAVGITGDLDLVYELARRAFLENRIRAMEDNARRLLKVVECSEGLVHERMLQKRLGRFQQAGLDLSRILFTKEQNEWIDAPYSPNPYYPENRQYPTDGGMLMRSKSETTIGNSLEAIGWPYRYDDLVMIRGGHGGEMPHRSSYYSDFKVPNVIGGITVHEHFGAFQIDQYSDNALVRLNDYRNFRVYELPNQAVRPEEFTWSLEADLREKSLMRQMIRRMLLPCGV